MFLPIIYLLSVNPVTLAFVCECLGSFCYLHVYLHISHSDGAKQRHGLVGPGPEDAVTFFFLLFCVKYLIYLTGFHCPVDSLFTQP